MRVLSLVLLLAVAQGAGRGVDSASSSTGATTHRGTGSGSTTGASSSVTDSSATLVAGTATARMDVQASRPHLTIMKTVSPEGALQGGSAVFHFRFHNAGSLEIHSVLLVDHLDGRFEFESTSGFDRRVELKAERGTGTVLVLELPGSLPPGAVRVSTVTVRISTPAVRE